MEQSCSQESCLISTNCLKQRMHQYNTDKSTGAVSPLGRSGDAPPKREREGFFSFTFNHSVTLAITLLYCLFCLGKYSPISIESRSV